MTVFWFAHDGGCHLWRFLVDYVAVFGRPKTATWRCGYFSSRPSFWKAFRQQGQGYSSTMPAIKNRHMVNQKPPQVNPAILMPTTTTHISNIISQSNQQNIKSHHEYFKHIFLRHGRGHDLDEGSDSVRLQSKR